MNFLRNNNSSKLCGFTLVELLAAVAIVGVIATLALPRYRAQVARARQAEATTNLGTIRELQKTYYYEDDRNEYHSGLHYGINKCGDTLSESLNGLGFRLSDCTKSRYRYITNAGNDCAQSDGSLDQGKVYPGCTANDIWHMSDIGKLTHTHDVIKSCPGGSSTSSCVAVALPGGPTTPTTPTVPTVPQPVVNPPPSCASPCSMIGGSCVKDCHGTNIACTATCSAPPVVNPPPTCSLPCSMIGGSCVKDCHGTNIACTATCSPPPTCLSPCSMVGGSCVKDCHGTNIACTATCSPPPTCLSPCSMVGGSCVKDCHGTNIACTATCSPPPTCSSPCSMVGGSCVKDCHGTNIACTATCSPPPTCSSPCSMVGGSCVKDCHGTNIACTATCSAPPDPTPPDPTPPDTNACDNQCCDLLSGNPVLKLTDESNCDANIPIKEDSFGQCICEPEIIPPEDPPTQCENSCEDGCGEWIEGKWRGWIPPRSQLASSFTCFNRGFRIIGGAASTSGTQASWTENRVKASLRTCDNLCEGVKCPVTKRTVQRRSFIGDTYCDEDPEEYTIYGTLCRDQDLSTASTMKYTIDTCGTAPTQCQCDQFNYSNWHEVQRSGRYNIPRRGFYKKENRRVCVIYTWEDEPDCVDYATDVRLIPGTKEDATDYVNSRKSSCESACGGGYGVGTYCTAIWSESFNRCVYSSCKETLSGGGFGPVSRFDCDREGL